MVQVGNRSLNKICSLTIYFFQIWSWVKILFFLFLPFVSVNCISYGVKPRPKYVHVRVPSLSVLSLTISNFDIRTSFSLRYHFHTINPFYLSFYFTVIHHFYVVVIHTLWSISSNKYKSGNTIPLCKVWVHLLDHQNNCPLVSANRTWQSSQNAQAKEVF